MKNVMRRGVEPVKPDNFSGVYQKGRKSRTKGTILGAYDPVSEKVKKELKWVGRALVVLAVTFIVLTLILSLNVAEGFFGFNLALFLLIHGVMMFLEFVTRGEIPQRNLIILLLWGISAVFGDRADYVWMRSDSSRKE